MLKKVLLAASLTVALVTSAAASDGLEVVAEWNSLPYAVKDAATRDAWEKSDI
ncbi:hypothetical protein [Cohaesibacter intestini]|uniref:hypothetical protein n=1 Tax=Cohaesibacter intestini TaxID=2211145 RepID=UPI0013006FB8|nr:hypothetical protein [Cohaesibacter intestini]